MKITKFLPLVFCLTSILILSCDYKDPSPVAEGEFADYKIELYAGLGYVDLPENINNESTFSVYKFNGIGDYKYLPLAVRPHYNFLGWSFASVVIDGKTISDKTGKRMKVSDSDLELRKDEENKDGNSYVIGMMAEYSIIKYNVRYVVGNESYNAPEKNTFHYFEDNTDVIPLPTDADGNEPTNFNGWEYNGNIVKTFGDLINILGDDLEAYKNVTLYGRWAKSYSYTLEKYCETPENVNNYSFVQSIVDSNNGNFIIVNEQNSHLDGYVLSEGSDGTYEITEDGSTVIKLFYDLATLNYTFDPNGGTFADNTTTSKTITKKYKVAMEQLDAATILNPTKDGCKLYGWKVGSKTIEPIQDITLDSYPTDTLFEAIWVEE